MLNRLFRNHKERKYNTYTEEEIHDMEKTLAYRSF